MGSGSEKAAHEVVFVCVHNAGRSQMAEAYFNHLAPAGWHATSAGTAPGNRINPQVVEVMGEDGITLIGQHPKQLTTDLAQQADRVITMGCGVEESCPAWLRISADWGLDDPAGQPIEVVRRIRDQVKQHTQTLIGELAGN